MPSTGYRRFLLSLLLLSLTLFLHITSPHNNATVAARMLSSKEWAKELRTTRVTNFNSSGNGVLDESKRRVPSCPDPLHNRGGCDMFDLAVDGGKTGGILVIGSSVNERFRRMSMCTDEIW
ncbi:hypothetical protein H6P81_008911 [Aristolochia fimbriata]|uniref:Uncharacterized protein n=1 Tax=Aristolochia fimbriata TaxID=158543 RepID=A0AAV7EM43_ARIFI|nr:hypothetical protein H6P81_008911 [Aristolochia fimbriata]